MSKRQKLSFFHLEGLPDEILLKILSFMDIKGVYHCGKVSKRLRAISNDKLLWSKLNLVGRQFHYGFIEKAVQNGCEYLKLHLSHVNGGKKSEVPWKLKYLGISLPSDIQWVRAVPKGVLENCHALQKLSIDNLVLDGVDVDQICLNGETLRILSLEGCHIDFSKRTELLQKLFTKCSNLTELNMSSEFGSFSKKLLHDRHAFALVDNLTPNILKLNLASQSFVGDKHVNTLVRRCTKITELDLSLTSITNDSIVSIVKHLKSLEKLRVSSLDLSTLAQLKSIPTLKVLCCFCGHEPLPNLKLQLPHISINEEYLNITRHTKEDLDWIWEIRAKQQYLFLKAH